MTILMNLVLLTNYLPLTLVNRMASWCAKTGLLLRWLALCLMNTKHLVGSGLRQLILRATSLRVYLHKLFKTTSYDLLTDKKPNVSYFKVFGAKCWIRDPHHNAKFAPKAHEGFMLGYGKDSHTYRVFNNVLHKVVETVDVRFDETNGSQKEHLPSVIDEPAPEETIKFKATEDVIQPKNLLKDSF